MSELTSLLSETGPLADSVPEPREETPMIPTSFRPRPSLILLTRLMMSMCGIL